MRLYWDLFCLKVDDLQRLVRILGISYSEDPEQGLRTRPPVPSTQLPSPDPLILFVYPTRVAGLMERRRTINLIWTPQ